MREAMVVSLAAQMQETESARAELARLEAEAVRAEQALCAKQEEFDRWREDARQEQKQSQARTQERIATLVVEKESAESMRDAVAVTLAAQMQETESARAELERLVESESSLLQRVSGMEEQQGRTLLDLQSQVRETASQRDDARAGLEKFELERVRLSAVAEEQGRTISELEARIAEQHTLAESLILDRAAAAEEFARLDGRADQERREAEGKLQELEREHSLALVGRELMVREHALSLAAQDQRLAEVLALAETEAHRSAMEAEQIEQSYEDRNAKMTQAHAEVRKEWEARIVELEKRNSDAKAQAQVEARHAASQREQLRQSYEQRIDQSREDHLRALVERDSQLKAVEWKLSNATTQRVEDGSLHAAAVAQVRQDYELRLAKAREEHMREVSVRDARVAALQRELAAMLREAIVQHAENTIQIPKPLGRISGSLRGLQGVPVSDDGSVDQAWQDWFDAPSEESPAARSVPWESAARAVRNGTGR